MSLPHVAVVNFSAVSDQYARMAVRAVDRQMTQDLQPVWGMAYSLELYAPANGTASASRFSATLPAGDAVIYLLDRYAVREALELHDHALRALPVGFVFTDLSDWTVSLSHEALEMAIDPNVGALIPGPDPRYRDISGTWLLHGCDVCDPVESTAYEIDGVRVSNFVTPSYFASHPSGGVYNDFLGVGVDPFGVLPGARLNALDPNDLGWVEILGHEHPSRGLQDRHFVQHATAGGRRQRPGAWAQAALDAYRAKPAPGLDGLPQLRALTRSDRRRLALTDHRESA
jgi:hypothetical protein